MIVEQIMQKELVTVLPTITMTEAREVMREKGVRHLNVLDEDRTFLGIVSERDIKEALPSYLSNVPDSPVYQEPITHVLIREPITAHPLDFVEEIALIFYEARIGYIPVVTNGQLVGVITTNDLLDVYIEMTGANEPGSKLEIRVNDVPGVLSDVTNVIASHNANVLSVLVYDDRNDESAKILSIRVQMLNPLPIITELREKGFHVLWPNVPGVL